MFIDTQLIPLRRDFPELKIVLEHITTREATQYVQASDRFVGATLTAHHLLFNRNAIFTGGIRPHYYCLPVLKRETHRRALLVCGNQRQSEVFSGHRQRPACGAPEARQRLRGLLHRPHRHGDVRAGV